METRLFNATLAWHNNEFRFKTQCAKHYKVPYQLLLARIQGQRKSHGGQNKTLSPDQESALCHYLDQCVYMGKYPDRRAVRHAANSILSYGGVIRVVSTMWTTRFLNRYPRYATRRTKPIAAERQAAGERTNIEKHFERWAKVMEKEKFLISDVYNFDETGFRIGCMAGRMVITHASQKSAYTADPQNRESVTVMETISADGKSIHPMVIMQGAIFKEKLFTNTLSKETLLAMSSTGFTNDMLALDYIEHFDKHTRQPRHPEAKRLLLMDGHGSHLTQEWLKYCDKNGIICFLLPSHSTHILQPLDIGIFQTYKHYHQEYLTESVTWGGIDFNKADFLSILGAMRERTFKSRIIRSAWRKAGLYPFNPQIVLDNMAVFVPPTAPVERPITPVEQIGLVDFSACRTPALRIDALQPYSDYIDYRAQRALKGIQPVTPTYTRVLDKRNKASNQMLHAGTLAIEELAKKSQAEKEKAIRRAGNKHVQKFGVITIGSGQSRMAARIVAEDREAEAKAARAEKCLETQEAKERAKEEKQMATKERQRLKPPRNRSKPAAKVVVDSEAIDLGPVENFASYWNPE